MKAGYLLPIGIFLAIAAVFGLVLFQISQGRDIKEVPSPLIGKAVPQFELPLLLKPGQTFSSEQLKGQVSLVNVWASWCVSCRYEHDLLVSLASNSDISIIGINYKDERADALKWLRDMGNPYEASIFDHDGRAAIDWGVYGTPESFIVDQQGIIRYKHTGPISVEKLESEILPLVRELRQQGSTA
jgi:cytochrome c biogenesis protein CcmG/thiol:disulfide interchange protein DsbE